MVSLDFSTGNDLKYALARAVCYEHGVDLVRRNLRIKEIQSSNPEDIVVDKANEAYKLAACPVVVSDDSWSIPALNGFPGPYMRDIAQWLNAQAFLNITAPLLDRTIVLTSRLAYADGDTMKIFTLEQRGSILYRPRGKEGSDIQKLISMQGDGGCSVSEVYFGTGKRTDKGVMSIWHDLAKWYLAR